MCPIIVVAANAQTRIPSPGSGLPGRHDYATGFHPRRSPSLIGPETAFDESTLLASVNIFSIADFDHVDNQHHIINRVENTVVPLSNSITLET